MSQNEVPTVEYVSPADLKVDGQNPNIMKPKQLEALRLCIVKYGFIVPIVTNKDLLIADGEQRWTIAKDLQMQKVPIVRLPIKDVDRRTLRQVLNKLRGEHELLGDAAEFERIIKAGGEEDIKLLLSLSDADIEQYMRALHEDKPENFTIPKIETVKTEIKLGDVFQMEKHRLMCADATNVKDALILLNGQTVDMVFTDPRYGINYLPETKELRKLGRLAGDGDYKKNPREFPLIRDSMPVIAQILKEGGPLYVCTGWQEIGLIVDTLMANGCHVYSVLVWDRLTPRMIGRRQDFIPVNEFIVYGWRRGKDRFVNFHLAGVSSGMQLTMVWRFRTLKAGEMTHTTEKPVELSKNAILLSSPKGGLVADLFGAPGPLSSPVSRPSESAASWTSTPAIAKSSSTGGRPTQARKQ